MSRALFGGQALGLPPRLEGEGGRKPRANIATAPGTAGKQLFLLTNSAFGFVDAGMRFLIGSDWRRRRRWNGPSTLSDGSALSARLVAPTAQPAPTDPRAQP